MDRNELKKKMLSVMLCAWAVVWIFYIGWDLFAKGHLKEYAVLLPMTLEEKRAYTTGGRLHDFISLANRVLPPGANCRIKGIMKDSLEYRRMVYYLYPHLDMNDADYILVYDLPAAPDSRYAVFARLDEMRYIMKRRMP